MNLPDNLSTTATRIYNLLATSQASKTAGQLADEFAQQPAGEERHKAIATTDSLIVKGIISTSKEGGETTYTLIKPVSEVGPDDAADAKEEYVEKTDANSEEKRIIDLLEQNNKTLPESKLFDLYEKEQLPASDSVEPAGKEDIEKALKELTDAGVVNVEGAGYSIKK